MASASRKTFTKESLHQGPIGRMQVSPDGKHTSFITNTRLTAYDNYGYGVCGRLGDKCNFDVAESTCGARKNGKSLRLVHSQRRPPSADVAASQNGLFMTDDGRTFFTTPDPLTKRDTNNDLDVYEYVDGQAKLISPGAGTRPRTAARPGSSPASSRAWSASAATAPTPTSAPTRRSSGRTETAAS